MTSYKCRSYCNRSYPLGGDCVENCWRLLTYDEKAKADALGLSLAYSDFYGTSYCVATCDEDE